MRILVTNDDGYHAEGLRAAEDIAAQLSDDVWVVAPQEEQSGVGRALSLSRPVQVVKHGERRFSVGGTPTDCVMLAMAELLQGTPPDLVLSGVNRGHNIAEDVTMSGTVAGALQGMALGVPSIALSQSLAIFHEDAVARFDTARVHGPGVIARLVEQGWPRDVVININFPDLDPDEVQAVEVTRQGRRDKAHMFAEGREDLRGRRYYWLGFHRHRHTAVEGTDMAALYAGRISVTPLHVDLTHMQTVHDLKGVLGGAIPRPPKAEAA